MITQICATENKLAATVLCYKIPSVQIQMKRLFVISIILFSFSACSESSILEPAASKSADTKQIFTKDEIVASNLNKIFNKFDVTIKDFDFTTFEERKLEDSQDNYVLIYNKHNRNIALVYYMIDGQAKNPFFLFSDKNSVTYYDLYNSTSLIVQLSPTTGRVSFQKDMDYQPKNGSNLRIRGCGQSTMDCISDAYSNHGWLSVWATVQTAFLPQTAAAIAGACAARNCLR